MAALRAPDPALVDLAGRFVLRPWEADDADALTRAWRDPEIAASCPVPADPSHRVATLWIAGWHDRADRGVALDLVIAAAPSDPPLGEIGLRRLTRPNAEVTGREDVPESVLEIGWWVAAPSRGQGLGRASVCLVVAWLRATTRERVIARIPHAHQRSARIAAAAGLVNRGELASGHGLWVAENGSE